MELDYEALGRRIRKARERTKMTQDRLAEKVNLSPSHMSHIESGKTKVSLPALVHIANVLDTTVDSLLHDNVVVTKEAFDKDFRDLIDDCDVREREIIYTAARQVKEALKT